MSDTHPILKTTIKKPRFFSMVLDGLNKANIIETLQFYGFTECAKMVRFLSIVVDGDVIDTASFKYLLANLNECIEKHARGYTEDKSLRYFDGLVKLRNEIEYVTSICDL